jgi:ribosomal protein S27AE
MSDSPFELLRLVTVATFSTPWEAQIAQARLAAEGIHSLIAGEHVIRMVALSNAIGGLQLQVREEDAGAAAEALQGFAPLPEIHLVGHETEPAGAANAADAADAADTADAAADEPPRSRCPTCGSGDLLAERSSRLVLGVLPMSRKAYRCGACGVLWKPEEIIAASRPARDAETAPGRQSEEEEPPLAAVARFHTPWEAHLARTLLESEGIRACVVEERLPAVNLLSAAAPASNRLEVRQEDAARASAILSRSWSYPSRVALPDGDSDDGPAGG